MAEGWFMKLFTHIGDLPGATLMAVMAMLGKKIPIIDYYTRLY